MSAGSWVLAEVDGQADMTLLQDGSSRLVPGRAHAVAVLDDGRTLGVQLDGRLVGQTWANVSDSPDPSAGPVSVALRGGLVVRDVELHPREVPMHESLDCGAPWEPAQSEVVVEEHFDLVAPDLHGSTTPSGGRLWSRDEGEGRIELHGTGARVRADRVRPNPGRTVFTVPWEDPDHADLCLDMTMPGTSRGEGHDGRCGVVLWQDADNYLVANLFVDDTFDGASVSTFYHLGGKENMYDAVWTLVRGVDFGHRCQLRVAFDGQRFQADVNGEPALTRALTDVYPGAAPLRIARVGIVVNREWGDDTGSTLHGFTAGGRRPAR